MAMTSNNNETHSKESVMVVRMSLMLVPPVPAGMHKVTAVHILFDAPPVVRRALRHEYGVADQDGHVEGEYNNSFGCPVLPFDNSPVNVESHDSACLSKSYYL
jgi:hypothetical protein